MARGPANTEKRTRTLAKWPKTVIVRQRWSKLENLTNFLFPPWGAAKQKEFFSSALVDR